MSLFCWTQRKIFWRMRETEQFWIIVFFFYYRSQWCPKTAWLHTFFRISSFVFRTNTFIQVWNYLRVNKWWQNFHFWVYCLFKKRSVSYSKVQNYVQIPIWLSDVIFHLPYFMHLLKKYFCHYISVINIIFYMSVKLINKDYVFYFTS